MGSLGLVICEKPSMAKSISAVLNAKQRRDGFFEGDGWLVSWCYGHLVELAPADAYGEQYKRWAYDTLPILPGVDDSDIGAWKYRVSENKKKQLNILRSLMKRADVESVVCATDAGREGELIFRLVYEQAGCIKPVQRLWISSLEDSAIREGFEKLRPGSDYDNLYKAALCRSKADWAVGINGTRLFSCLYGATLNVGRVQSPTLAMIADREAAINDFTSEPFYTPVIDCGAFTATGEKLKDGSAAEAVRSAADGQDAVVVSVERQQKSIVPPKLYDLTALQRDANRLFGFTAQQTLDYVQSMYEMGYVSYPRSDSKYITADMRDTVLNIIGDVDFTPDIDHIVGSVSDHHAIIPTLKSRAIDISALPLGEGKVFGLIRKRLIAAVSLKHVYEEVTVSLDCEGHIFKAKGKTVISAGWKTELDDKEQTGDGEGEAEEDVPNYKLPELSEGQIFGNVTVIVKEGFTKPPARFTEGTLLRAMETAGADDFPEDSERKGLGTPATRAAIIEKLIKSGFVERQKKSLVPTAKGINLIAVLPEEIKSPLLTAEWEQKLALIEKGELTDLEFMDGISTLVSGLVAAHTEPVAEYAALFGQGVPSPEKGEIGGVCPRCGSSATERDKGYFCSSQTCKFVLWKESRFWSAKGKKLDRKTAAALLKEGRVFFSDLVSERTGKTYAAAIILDDTGDRVNFKLDFNGRDRK